ncbi:peptide/nickel transport system ATP-binding protein [Saccharopolyspora erythraea NRRL 2338]|uniref:ABC transporter related n=2 Tax=Saccharopolyspora erythraea TaxID=1836 RepID=A4F977_SACEN|nr:ABC transporter ATP-binding protein [Saccharopolyspora erythraea]EQD87157.1 peptide ABC transporter ATPase [Saccharopolyspora erythraea D]PFG94394.1 peptide/nickel transport system ATP-binding protein [Saccharopolyspora erythraea NRRL 2338]QRK91158.1 ABC transporter ATP-binding protein [Saccharopolyspora erythraea]CAM00602.1 ABC transporter related [Saccharopolyspora erythraea NRRL 2338]
MTVLAFSGLSVRFRTESGTTDAVRDVDFALEPGEVLAVVGESGSGKSVTAMAALGLLPPNAEVTGSIRVDGSEVVGRTPRELRRIRGGELAMIFQEPMTSLNPVFTIGWQIAEAVRMHTDLSRSRARARAVELLEAVGIPEPRRRLRHYPHQLSGGQRQRVMIAMALACEPKVLIADEPTTALDVTVQAGILALLRDLRDRLGMTILLITHDMGVVADLADRVVVMYRGEVVEQASVEELFAEPGHEYTRTLLSAVPRLDEKPDATAEPAETPVLEVHDLAMAYGGQRVVDGVSLRIGRGQTLGLVGESGSGKSTVGRCVTRLAEPVAGRVVLNGQDITHLPARRLRPLRRKLGIVFQDPGSSLDPRMSIGDSIAEPLRLHRAARGRALERRVAGLLDAVELSAGMRGRHPHELSGGQRQRVSIARALALDPELLVADEPTSALDVSVQDAVLELLLDLQRKLGFGCLFISHDLAVVNLLASRVAVMHRGTIVEAGETARVLGEPEHAYTRRLLDAAPIPDPVRQRERRLASRA